MDAPAYVDDTPLAEPPVRALSLAVAQKCNLGCTLLLRRRRQLRQPGREHAGGDRARLGRPAALPGGRGERVNLAFLGGEPLLNRGVLRAATERAYVLAAERGIDVTFSITTNGTRLTVDDGDFFEAYGFAVTVSVDGIGRRTTGCGRSSADRGASIG